MKLSRRVFKRVNFDVLHLLLKGNLVHADIHMQCALRMVSGSGGGVPIWILKQLKIIGVFRYISAS